MSKTLDQLLYVANEILVDFFGELESLEDVEAFECRCELRYEDTNEVSGGELLEVEKYWLGGDGSVRRRWYGGDVIC